MFDHDQPAAAGQHETQEFERDDLREAFNAGWTAAREVGIALIASKEAQIAQLQTEIAALRGITQT